MLTKQISRHITSQQVVIHHSVMQNIYSYDFAQQHEEHFRHPHKSGIILIYEG